MRKDSKLVNIIIIGTAIIFVVILNTTLLYVAGIIGSKDGEGEGGYQNTSLTDALLTCENRIEKRYGDRVKYLTTNDHSNRYSYKSHEYLIFFELHLRDKGAKTFEPHYANCFVRAKNGKINKFAITKDSPERYKPEKDDGLNAFGVKNSSNTK